MQLHVSPPRPRAPVFAALGDSTRLALFERLGRARFMSISALTAQSGVTRQAVAKHLQILSEAGLVTAARSGREQHYRVNPEALTEVAEWITAYRQVCEQRLDQLDEYLQTLQPKDP